MRSMTSTDFISAITSRFANLRAKDAEIAVPVSEKPVPYFQPGKDLRERVEASAGRTLLRLAASDVAE
jgi:nucleoid DNA-binding protein